MEFQTIRDMLFEIILLQVSSLFFLFLIFVDNWKIFCSFTVIDLIFCSTTLSKFVYASQFHLWVEMSSIVFIIIFIVISIFRCIISIKCLLFFFLLSYSVSESKKQGFALSHLDWWCAYQEDFYLGFPNWKKNGVQFD